MAEGNAGSQGRKVVRTLRVRPDFAVFTGNDNPFTALVPALHGYGIEESFML